MRQVTIEKIISSDCIRHRAVRRVSTFKAGEIVKFNTADGVITAIVTLDRDAKCGDCVFFGLQRCPNFKSNNLQGAGLLCNHHRYEDRDIHFKPLDYILEEL